MDSDVSPNRATARASSCGLEETRQGIRLMRRRHPTPSLLPARARFRIYSDRNTARDPSAPFAPGAFSFPPQTHHLGRFALPSQTCSRNLLGLATNFPLECGDF